MSAEKLESSTPDVVEAVRYVQARRVYLHEKLYPMLTNSLYAAWYALEVFEYLCERTGAPKG
jgi:hypothetical protein